MGNGVSATRAATAEVAASAVLTSDDAYLDVDEVVKKVRACDKDGNGKIDRQELQGLLASISVQGAAGATAAKEDFISQAAGGVVDVGKDKDGKVVKKVWMKDDNPIGYLWLLYGPLLLMAKLGKLKAVVEDNKVVRTAVQMVAACLGGFDTIVLATVFAGNWRSCWVSGLIATLLRNIPRCRIFVMFAVKGGAACDCEIQFTEIFMELLGAEVRMKAEDQGKFLLWQWNVKRDGADDCFVCLHQYKTVEDATVASIKVSFLAQKKYAHAPNLKRCAVVSAPERDIAGEPIAARLNKNVGDALAAAKELAATYAW